MIDVGVAVTSYDEPNLSWCNWYQGVGICSYGCREEPACETDEPCEGWPVIEIHPMHAANRRARRMLYRIERWIGWTGFSPYRKRGEYGQIVITEEGEAWLTKRQEAQR